MKIKLVAFIMLLFSFLYTGENVSASVISTTDSTEYDVDEIVSKEELKDGYTINKPVNVLGEEYYFSVNDFYYDGYSYLAVGYVDAEEGVYYDSYPYVAYYENEKLVWSKVYNSLGLGEFKSYIFEDDQIIIAGEYETNGIVYPFIINFDYEGNIIKQKIFLNLQNSFIEKIYTSYSNYILVGLSFSNEYEFKDRSNNNNIFFTYLMDSEYNKIDLLYFGNDLNNSIYEVLKCGSDIIIYGLTQGEGEFDLNGKSQAKVCITITERCEYGNFAIVPSDVTGLITLVNYQSKPYLVNKKYDDYIVGFYEINDDVIKYSFSLNDDHLIETTQRLKIDTYDNIIVLCEKVNNNGNCYLYISTYKNSELFYRNVIKETFSYDLANVLYDGVDIIYYGQYISSDTSLFSAFALQNIKLYNDYCAFNGVSVLGEKKEIDYDIFGNHTGYSLYSHASYNVLVDEDVYIDLETNVVDGCIYDVNSVLWFNGEGYLNNEYVGKTVDLSEEGMYLLEIRGEDERVVYKIYVSKLTINLSEMSGKDNINNINFSVLNNTVDRNLKMSYSDLSNKITENDDNISIYIAVTMIIICLGLGILIPIKKKKEVIINA